MGTPNDRFLLACNELGWGDAANALWFVSIEEASDWKPGQESKIENHYSFGRDGPYFRDDEVERKTRTPGEHAPIGRSQIDAVEAKICAPLSASCKSLGLMAYKANLWGNGQRVAHGNLYPLGKPRLGALPAWYEALFGFGSGDADTGRYQAAVKSIRFPSLREARRRLKPQAIVCLGKTYWREFREAFEVTSKPVEVEKDKVLAYTVERVILAPHFAYGWIPDERAEAISAVLRTWAVSLP